MFENKVLRRIFGPKRDEVTGEWRKLHNEELHDLYSSPSIIFFLSFFIGNQLLQTMSQFAESYNTICNVS
jgi:hypothetical protein